ncbi:glycosyl transferase [Cryptobacterium curtum DSM 15641]|uniref:Glycosyl transferase n=1 Tax=Cryptobacterium curtum (strain ATCC 700683 / DSM 15641 / CCUG 43107 / 12-3) TaxID=469378 RepID=C7MN19_CRYCD|nr:glycosyltransferase [Cryptobacterium curtum]ACU94309.1 glycosyl transferase [Cryptobacterium curtum DSM 15641]
MANPLISVIVPVYNVEKYLDRCMQSIVDQTYRNLEIILVDDGSSDGSGALCDTWAQQDNRIIVLHKKNGGLSDARNAGVQTSHGDWIGFVDSDDYIDKQMYESLYSLIEYTNSDMALCAVADVYADHTDVPAMSAENFTVLTTKEVLSDIFLNKTLMVGVPPRLYPAWLVREVPSPAGKTHEDAFIVVDLFSRVEHIVIDRVPRYFYCHNEGTITSTPSLRAASDNIEAWEHNRVLVEKLYPDLMQDVLFRCYWAHFDVLDGMMLSNAEMHEQQKVINYLLSHKADILAHPHVSAKRKLALRLLSISKKLYRLLVMLQNRHIRYN